MTDQDPTCSFDNCERPIRSGGLCASHWMQQYKGKKLTPLRAYKPLEAEWPKPRTDGLCAIPGCLVQPHARGLCRSHYSQFRYGRPVGPVRHKNPVRDGAKRCGQCGAVKPIAGFGKQLRGVQSMCLECRRVDTRMRAYGLTREEVLALCEVSQCEACGGEIDSSTRNHHVDHCHTTGVIRGVLCGGCNTALGLTKENPETLRRLADYIESRSAVTA